MREVLTQVWLRDIGQTSECINKRTSRVHASSHKPTKKCVMKMKVELEKNNMSVKMTWWKERVYKARAKNKCHRYQKASSQ